MHETDDDDKNVKSIRCLEVRWKTRKAEGGRKSACYFQTAQAQLRKDGEGASRAKQGKRKMDHFAVGR